jgi:hypothetical protein
MPTLDRDETVIRPTLGGQGEPCASCGAPLAADQRYCLNCGVRRAEPRIPAFRELLTREPVRPGAAAAAASPPPPPPPARDWTPMLALGALGMLATVLVVGVLIGRTGFGDGNGKAPAPQVVSVAPGTGAGGTPVAASQFKSDWPDAKEGYTVELGVLPKTGTQPAAIQKAKSDATAKGASDVGALDSDQYASLPTGNYVVYSGVFDSKGQADKALKALKSKFPDAQVVQVSQSAPGGSGGSGGASGKAPAAVKDLQNATGADYVKKSQKLPTTLGIPGAPPPTDNKAPGGGSGGGETIK